jgi:hypothetical protein
MSNTTTRNDVKQLAESIEALAREVQSKLQNNGDFLASANELVRKNLTMVFTLGEVYALEQMGTGKAVKATVVSGPASPHAHANWHNLRDSRGRFAKKI